MQRIFSIFSVLLFCLVLALYYLPPKVFAADDTTTPKAIITEVRLGGDLIDINGTPAKEYVSIYNQSDEELTLNNFRLEYVKDDYTGNCADSSWGGTPSTIRNLEGILQPGEVSSFKYNLSNDTTLTDTRSGSIRLIEVSSSQSIVHDLVGWGDNSVCFEGMPEPLNPLSGESLQRYIGCDTGKAVDTDNNLVDFALSGAEYPPTPGVLAGPLTVGCPDGSSDDGNPGNNQNNDGNSSNGNEDTGGLGGGPQNSCEGVIISELLPNPAGTDSGHEFIELYNPTEDIIDLAGCKIQTSANSKTYEFADLQLQPGHYKAFYNDVTGLTLTNSGGGSVYVIDTDDTEIDQADYSPNLDDDVSWSLIDGGWMQTFSLTPDKSNELLTFEPCPTGQFRNLETNRCNNMLEEAAGLGSCAPGKERNSETHRCRNITSLASTLKACASDQYRNPSTNRCRKYSSASTLKPCQPNQERNPETNRCRKSMPSSAVGGINDVKDVLSSTAQVRGSNWSFAIFSVIGAFSYGLWEWRNEILQKLSMLKVNFS